MKRILVSNKSESAAKILNGEKTIEILKTAPKCELPIEVYVYCAESAPYLHPWNEPAAIEPCGPRGTNKVTWKKSWRLDKTKRYMSWNGKVVAKFTLNKVETIKLPYTKFGSDGWVGCEAERTLQTRTMDEKTLLEKSCLGEGEIYGHLNFKHSPYNVGYAWHIEDLEIFDEPRELSEFYSLRLDKDVTKLIANSTQLSNGKWVKRLDKAPRTWRYVEEEE